MNNRMHLRLNLVFAAVIAGVLSAAAHAAEGDSFPGVENLMSAEEFSEAGLDKLSAAEREALNRWLVRYTVGDAPVIREKNPEVRKADKEQSIRARVTGDFDGWSGGTVFRLDNGQVWQQRYNRTFFYKGEDREVLIDRNFLGFFRLRHVATGNSVAVKRID